MEVGRFNVLIGENGCGKSNILEAITFAAAAEANKLDNEFLVSRGIRVTEPELMRSGFESKNSIKDIKIAMGFSHFLFPYTLKNNNTPYSKWIFHERYQENIEFDQFYDKVKKSNIDLTKFEKGTALSCNEEYEDTLESINVEKFFRDKNKINNFIIYSPENTSLRTFSKEGQIQPLGINGEGLLKLLKVIQQQSAQSEQDVTPLDDIKECLALFDWYESIDISSDFAQAEQKINIKDRYLENVFDQRSANEGFLFVLFYIALMVSEDTPKIFAIDNIDASLNPKLCTKLIKELTRLAKKYGKQVFVTTHNPAILDGIDLADDEQRLIVVSRNKQGYTRCKRIELKDKPKSSTDEPLKLSEAFLRGYLGGLPKGF
ncbi:MAG: ATP-binding protein [Methylococcaceae bacterium]|nr:ATP-binding protein [Methylococcaceae bacterium]